MGLRDKRNFKVAFCREQTIYQSIVIRIEGKKFQVNILREKDRKEWTIKLKENSQKVVSNFLRHLYTLIIENSQD